MERSFLFGIWPYVAGLLFLAGTLIRYILARRRITVVKEQFLHVWVNLKKNRVWRISLLLLLSGHLIGLLFPGYVRRWNSNALRLYFLEGSAFLIGIVALASWTRLIRRHLRLSGRSLIFEIGDTVFLSFFLLVLLSGSLLSVFYRWGSSWGVTTLTPYVMSVLKGQPTLQIVTQMPFLVKLHIFSAFGLVAAFPLSRPSIRLPLLMHFCWTQLGKLVLVMQRPAEGWLGRHNPAMWIWPEEE